MNTKDGAAIDPLLLLQRAGWPPPLKITPVSGGWDTLVWRFATPDRRQFALRLFRPEAAYDGSAQARREAAILRYLNAAGLAVPEVAHVAAKETPAFLILTWQPGVPLLQILSDRPWTIWRFGREFGRTQARLHRLPLPESAGDREAIATDWVARTDEPALEDAVRAVAQSTSICHLDFHPINVLTDGRSLTGLLDLSTAAPADRRADLGRTYALLTAAAVPPHPLKPVVGHLRRLLTRAWISGYRAEAGDFPLEPLFQAWGIATMLRDTRLAVAEGRGWATVADVAVLETAYRDAAKKAGLP